MKKYITLFFLLSLSFIGEAQFTSVTATVVDSDGQAWINGFWSATLYNPRSNITPSINGTSLTTAQLNPSGILDSSGNLSASLADNSQINPIGTYWQFVICPKVSVQCSTVTTPVSGTSSNISSVVNANIKAPRFQIAPIAYGYSDIEVTPAPNPGGVYFNVLTNIQRIWTGTAWQNNAGGGGGGTSGVNLNITSQNVNCTTPGPIFTQWSCDYFQIRDNGTSVNRNLAGVNINQYAYGGNAGSGTTEARSSQQLGGYGAIATAGIKNVWQESTSCYGVGDCLIMNWGHMCYTGVMYTSDQGCQGIFNILGEGSVLNPASSRGYFTATVSGGSNTSPTFSSVGNCNSFLNQECLPSPGSNIIDTSSSVSATITGPSTGFSSSVTGCTSLSWLNQWPTSGSLPTVSTWGCAIGINISPNGYWGAPVNTTITWTGHTGTFTSGSVVCVLGDRFQEQQTIVSATSTSITIPLTMNENSVAIFQGPCRFTSFNADLALGTRTAHPSISIDGSNLVYAYYMYGGSGTILPITGSEPQTTDGTANAGITLYQGAKVLTLNTTNPTAIGPLASIYLITQLEPNNVFTNGDTVEDPDFPAQKVNGIINSVNQNMPSNSSANEAAMDDEINGMGAANLAYVHSFTNLFHENDCSVWAIGTCGGRLTPPTMSPINGFFSTFFNANYLPAQTIWNFNGVPTGLSSYGIIKSPWGQFLQDPTHFLFINTNLSIPQGGVIAQQGIQGGSLQAGAGTPNFYITSPSSGVVYFGATNNNADGEIGSKSIIGPATAPTGSCSPNGIWEFTQDGHASFCNSGTWVLKI